MRERWWSGEARYPGLAQFWIGSVRATGSEHARRELLALWARISPHPAPDEITPQPGRLVLQEDDDE